MKEEKGTEEVWDYLLKSAVSGHSLIVVPSLGGLLLVLVITATLVVKAEATATTYCNVEEIVHVAPLLRCQKKTSVTLHYPELHT